MPPKTKYLTHTIHFVLNLDQELNELQCTTQK